MTDFFNRFNNLPDSEKDKIALLRVIECTNGVIQQMYRSNDPSAFSVEKTRKAMKYSMGCIKNMTITIGLEEITFEEPTQLLVREMRDLYISGFKNGNADDFEKFLDASRSNLEVVGVERIDNAAELVRAYVDDIPKKSVQWGIGYIKGFMGWM